jgi:hypothetical protein
MKKFILTLSFAVAMASIVFALTEASVGSATERGRWTGAAAGSDSTEGGNITGINVSGDMLTEKWAAYYGNVTGSVMLTDSAGTNNVYSWSWAPADGGEVCLSQDNNFPWASAEAAVRADVDTAFGFTAGDADSAANTYTDASCPLTINEVAGAITSTGTTLLSGFDNCVLGDGIEAAEGDFAFCTEINDAGTNWNSEAANYEIMVPTTETAGATETYYFYVELN